MDHKDLAWYNANCVEKKPKPKFKDRHRQRTYQNALYNLKNGKGEKLKELDSYRGSSIDTMLWSGIQSVLNPDQHKKWPLMQCHPRQQLYPLFAAGRDWARTIKA